PGAGGVPADAPSLTGCSSFTGCPPSLTGCFALDGRLVPSATGASVLRKGHVEGGLRGSDPALHRRQGAVDHLSHVGQRVPLHVTQRPGDALIDGEAPQHTVDLREQRTRLRPRRLRRQGVEVDGLLSSEAQGAQKPSASQSRAHEANDDGSEPAPKRSRLPELVEAIVRSQESIVNDVL